MDTSDLWKPVVAVALLFSGMLLLSVYGPGRDSVAAALEWTASAAGILVTVAGVISSAESLKAATTSEQRLLALAPGVVGVLAGSSLLGVGAWGAPVGLGIAGAGLAMGTGLALGRSGR